MRHLERYEIAPILLSNIISDAIPRLLDSKMIIEDPFTDFMELTPAKIEQPLPLIENDELIRTIIEKIGKEGFGCHFMDLTSQLGAIMIQMCASSNQKSIIQSWGEKGSKGVFLMTDKGGPNLSSWLSEVVQEGDGSFNLKINKIWGIEAKSAQFCIVNVRQKSAITPVAFILSPEKYQQLNKVSIGRAFLEHVNLGNVEGSIAVTQQDRLDAGGIAGVNRFLSLARPRFVLSVMAHLGWLASIEKLKIGKSEQSTIEYITSIAKMMTGKKIFNKYSIDEILALKMASNEFLLHLVLNRSVAHPSIERDLLALGKMEGSSYRCMYELYSKAIRAKVAA